VIICHPIGDGSLPFNVTISDLFTANVLALLERRAIMAPVIVDTRLVTSLERFKSSVN